MSQTRHSAVIPPWDTSLEEDAKATLSSPRYLSLPLVPVVQRGDHSNRLVPVESPVIPNRIRHLEERLQVQERTTQALIERAHKIKDDAVNSLNFAKGTREEEKKALHHLQEHIFNITAVVKRLNSDILAIEKSIKLRDNAQVGTNQTVKNLEMKQAATLSDLKGGVVSCDSAVAKLGVDVASCSASVQQLNKQHHDLSNRITQRLKDLEQKLIDISNHVERSSGESRIKLSHLEGNTNTHMSRMDNKTRQVVEETKTMMSSLETNMADQQELTEQRLASLIKKDDASKTLILEKLGRKIDDMYNGMDARIIRVEKLAEDTKRRFIDAHNKIEAKIREKMDGRIKQNTEGLLSLKQENLKTFAMVHENVNNMKSVLEGRHKLLGDKLLEEIALIQSALM